MKKLLLLPTVIIAFVLSAAAQNAQPDTATLHFITEAAKGGLTEVNSGKLAVQKAKSASIKAFGARMIKDHSKANTELMAIVTRKRWKIASPSPTVIAPDAMLKNSTGATFDQSYVNMMVKDHQKTVRLFERGAQVPDADIKAFATKTLPILKQHLTSIQAIANKMGIAYEK